MLCFGKFWRDTLMVRIFGCFKVPMLGYAKPCIIDITSNRLEVKIPLNRRTKNHLNCMYFGALAVGADTVVGFLAMKRIQSQNQRVDLIFKDFQAKYKKRAEGDVHFICEEGATIDALVKSALASSERVEKTISAHAVVPSINPKEVVAEFALTLSLKKRG